MGPRGREGGEARGQVDAADLPPELAFIPAAVVPTIILQRVARTAEAEKVTAERVLLAAGHLTADHYDRLLAAHLGLPFAERPLRPASGATVEEVLRVGAVPLVPNPFGWTWLIAPRGLVLRSLLAAPPLGRTHAITSPERLEALVRHEHRQAVAHAASHGLPDWNDGLSARGGVSAPQLTALVLVAAALCAMAWLDPAACLAVLSVVFYSGFLMNAALRVLATAVSPRPQVPTRERLADHVLPLYTIVVPLFREAREVRRLIAALGRLDYPRSKLDIILMIEANDRSTLRALDRLHLPACYRVIMAPAGVPQTKPRALNVALQFARGRYLVVYDAEDDPEPNQLRAALAGFTRDPGLACLQAQLAIDNTGDAWITRLFALEYAALFHVVNPGLAALSLPIPLGGTSNHFRVDVLRRVNAWDAWNVTEDIDLGIRLARFGHRVGTIASTTLEEAPRTHRAWLAQRRRWQKGWIVTLVTHSRDPLRCWRELGARGGAAVTALLFGAVASSLLGPFCFAYLVMRASSGLLLHPQTHVDAAWSIMSGILLVVGAASALGPVWLGLERRRMRKLFPWSITLPLYFLLLSVAAWQALFEIAWRPYFWAKTEHGRAKRRVGLGADHAGASAFD